MPSLEDALEDEKINVKDGDEVKIGGNTDHVEFYDDGTPRLRGAATVWNDMVSDLFGKRLASISGSVDYDYDENAIKFQNNGIITTANDRVGSNQQIGHNFKVGSSIIFKPHIHWFQENNSQFVWTARYRLQRNNAIKTTAWTTITSTAITDDVFTYPGSGVFNQLTRFPDIIVDCSISDTIQWQMTRSDALVGDALVYFFDLHGEIDSLGSDEEISKRI